MGKKTKKPKQPVMKMVRELATAIGWKVITKSEAAAAFFIPLEDGTGWSSTAGVDGGGRVS